MVSRTHDCEIASQHWERCPTIVCALSPRRLSEAADLMGAKDHYERTFVTAAFFPHRVTLHHCTSVIFFSSRGSILTR
jgi:hypothetical protein